MVMVRMIMVMVMVTVMLMMRLGWDTRIRYLGSAENIGALRLMIMIVMVKGIVCLRHKWHWRTTRGKVNVTALGRAAPPFNVDTSDAAMLHSAVCVANGLPSPWPRPADQH